VCVRGKQKFKLPTFKLQMYYYCFLVNQVWTTWTQTEAVTHIWPSPLWFVYSGQSSIGPTPSYTAGLFIWNLATGTFTIDKDTGPPLLEHGQLIALSSEAALLLYGGYNNTGPLGEFWKYNVALETSLY